MLNFIKFGVAALFSYVIAAPLTSHISMDVSQTDWANLWTYAFWAFGSLIWSAFFAVGIFIIAAIITVFDN